MLHHWIACVIEVKVREQGQGLLEYALILLFVAAAAVGLLTVLGTSVSGMLNAVAGVFP
ncbi:MAG: Flp family type IVb pilin [Thermoleophilaceae bacterium]